MRSHHIVVATVAALALPFAGCGDSTTGCRSDTDCPGMACVVGVCRPVAGADLAVADADGALDGGGHDGAHLPDLAADLPAALCNFNNDGILQRSEAPFVLGLGALFAVNPPSSTVPVDLTPHSGTWDFSAATSGEQKIFDQLLDPKGQWWAKDFPTATHAEKLDDGQDLFGVYQATDTALKLLGVVSATSGVSQTELTYATPVDVLRFPLAKGDAWTATSTVSGLASGIFIAASDTYAFHVDLRGTTIAPAGSFDTLRLRLSYSETIGFITTTRFTDLHLAECYGAVARVRSKDNETSQDFTQATEYRRLATQ